MKKNIIIGIGEILWDMLPSGKRAGGAPVNFVYLATLEPQIKSLTIPSISKKMLKKVCSLTF